MNSISIAGTIGRDAELRSLSNGDPVASFSVADNQGKDKSPIWWSASLFGKRATSLAPYLQKGQAVTITGTVSEREYVNKDGVTVKSMDIRVADVALQGGKREASAEGYQGGTGQRDTKPAARKSPDADPFIDSDIPF